MGAAGRSPWWARYSSPPSVDTSTSTAKRSAHPRVPSSLLLRLFNVLLVLSCSPVGSITAHGAVAGSKAEDRGAKEQATSAPSASALRSSAELAVSKGEHEKAIRLFSQVIELEPKNERNFYKRFRVFLSKRKYAEAIKDLSRALELKPKYKQALAQRAKLLRMMGQCEEAAKDYAALEVIDPKHVDLETLYPLAKTCAEHLADGAAAEAKGDWQAAAEAYDAILDEQLDLVGAELLLRRARCHFALGRWLQAAADAGRAAKVAAEADDDHAARERAQALELRGRCYIHLGDFELAGNHFRQVLLDDPDNEPCREEHRRCRAVVKKVEAGHRLLSSGDVVGATNEWRAATALEPDNAAFLGPLLLQIASAHVGAKNWAEAKRAAQECLNAHPHGEVGAQAEMIFGDVYTEAEEFQEAVNAYSRAEAKVKEIGMEILDQARAKLKQANILLEQSKKKQYYKILGVPRNADLATIKKAYRELAKIHHPDKVQGEEEKLKSEKIFQEVAEAYEVLGDDELRAKYDRGEEVFENQGGGGGQARGGGQHFRFNRGGGQHFQRTHVRFVRGNHTMGDDLLELAKAKELASVMGGAWHSEDWDTDSDSEQPRPKTPTDQTNGTSANGNDDSKHKGSKGGFLSRTLSGYQRKGSAASNGSSSVHSSATNGDGGGGGKAHTPAKNGLRAGGGGRLGGRRLSGSGRRPADGRPPGRRDPAAVARLEAEAEARRRAELAQPEGVDRSWQLPTNVDYYTSPAALLRELVKEMPADKRLSFQTRVANARTKEEIESLLEDYAERLECLVLPHARSREIDLQQVKKDTARERVVLDGKEIAFWGSTSDKPHTWHEELWATLESRVMDGLLGGDSQAIANGSGRPSSAPPNGHSNGAGTVVGDNARALAREEWNKTRAVATTSEVFKAMSRTGAGGDAYFALVALFCTADKLVVPVHCQESPITVEFLSRCEKGGGGGWGRKSGRHSKARAAGAAKKGGKGRTGDDVHVLVTVPSTFDIYLRDGAAASENRGHGKSSSASNINSGGGGGGSTHARGNGSVGGSGSGKMHRKASTGSTHSNGDGAAAADASAALHLVRVKAVVEEEIWVVGSSKVPASSSSSSSFRGGRGNDGAAGGRRPASADDDTPPALRFLLDPGRDERRTSLGPDGRRLSNGHLSSRGRPDLPAAGGGPAGGGAGGGGGGVAGAGELSMSPPPSEPTPLLALTRTERRMCVTVVPEPSAVTEMVRSFSRKMGVDVPGPQPPRVLGR
eukprot:g6323.t1